MLPSTAVSEHEPNRRGALKRLGLTAGGLALGVAACDETEGDAQPLAPPDAAPDVDVADQGPIDAGADAQDPDAARPPTDLEPLRGDGSHPFHYLDTLVVLQMENRSFDHVFGSLSLLEGRTDVDGLAEGMSNPGPDGVVPIFPLGDDFAVSPDPPHGHRDALLQYGDGAMDGFVAAYSRRGATREVMGYYTRDELPVSYALADHFTLCHRWFAGAMAPTWPNRYFTHCATSDGELSNGNFIQAPTLYPALRERGLRFGTYFHNLFFSATIRSLVDSGARKHDQFFEDAANGDLPNVAIVEPAFFLNDDHPPADVRLGQAFLGSVYAALRASPQWDRCMLVVLYDENGGFFDHAPPPLSRGDERADAGFGRLGFRIPGLVAGPLARRGAVLDTVVEHSSLPKLIADIFELDPLNERAELAGDLGDALDLSYVRGLDRPPPPELPMAPLPMQALLRGLRADSGQPELQAWMRQMGFAHHDSLPERRRGTKAWLDHARRLGAVAFPR